MRNFFYRISAAAARFMYGRNGSDQLNTALLGVYLAAGVLQAFLTRHRAAAFVLQVFMLAAAVLVLFRMLSRNLSRRRAENARFLRWWYPVRNRFAGARQRRLDKEHKYFTCGNCRTICRVPAGKGKIEITCPRCGRKILGKS